MKCLLPILLLVFSVGVGADVIKYRGGLYVGQASNGAPHGHGTFTWSNGDKYVGEWKFGHLWKGTKYDKNGNVTATYSEGVRNVVN